MSFNQTTGVHGPRRSPWRGSWAPRIKIKPNEILFFDVTSLAREFHCLESTISRFSVFLEFLNNPVIQISKSDESKPKVLLQKYKNCIFSFKVSNHQIKIKSTNKVTIIAETVQNYCRTKWATSANFGTADRVHKEYF